MPSSRRRHTSLTRHVFGACVVGGVLGLVLVAGCSAILGVTDLVGIPDASSGDAQVDAPKADQDALNDVIGAGDGDSPAIDSRSTMDVSPDAIPDAVDVAMGSDSTAADSSGGDGRGPADGAADVADAPQETTPDASDAGPFDAAACATGVCRRVFVTATQMGDGNIGALGAADGICQSSADSVSIGGSWKAWLTDATASAFSRFVQANVPYRLLDGTLIANDWADLTSGRLRHAIDVDETKRPPIMPLEVWTGATAYAVGTGTTCSDWTSSNAASLGTVGLTNASDSRWSDAYTQFCDRTNVHLYCFEQ